MMKLSPWLLAGALLVLAPGCKKPQHSAEYTEASGAWSTVTAKLGDDAYADPEMTRIEGLLKSVPADSLDAAAAQELLAKIQSERKRVEDDAAAHKRLLEAAERGSVMAPDSPRSPDEVPSVETPDAGHERIHQGMTTDEVYRASDDCFAFTQNMRVRNADGTEVEGVVWERRTLAKCKELFPDMGDRMLVFEHNKLEQIVQKSLITHEILKPDAGASGQQAPQKTEAAPTQAPPPGEPPTDQAPPIPSRLPPPVPPGENTGAAPTE